MLSFFLRIMKQKCGSYVCVQLLQTLNILFENIRNETSLYYLLSNNHVNSIIVHKFDFSDEEVMAYYISFLKTLSLKLNAHTIHFFYNEVNKHTNDFPLYTEAIKFFNHTEGMVRIAVRTLTLNVYRVEDASMLKFIRDRTAAPYFSNLVWFIGNHILELDTCVRNDADHQSQNRLSDLVAEHLDHLHYLNDILCLDIEDLNKVLSDHLLHKLLVPLHVYSLMRRKDLLYQNQRERKFVSTVVALFLLSQVFLIVSHGPLIKTLAAVIIKSNEDIVKNGTTKVLEECDNCINNKTVAFSLPAKSLETSLDDLNEFHNDSSKLRYVKEIKQNKNEESTKTDYETEFSSEKCLEIQKNDLHITENTASTEINALLHTEPCSVQSELDKFCTASGTIMEIKYLSVTDEEKEHRLALESPLTSDVVDKISDRDLLSRKPFLETIFDSLYCSENDYTALLALCLLYALTNNKNLCTDALGMVLTPLKKSAEDYYNQTLIDRIIRIISLSCQTNTKVRLVTLELSIKLLVQLVIFEKKNLLQDSQLTAIRVAREQSTATLRNFYKSEDIFLDMFEDEFIKIQKKPIKVEWLMMDSNILLPPTGTPMTGIEFSKRLPCGEVERSRRAIRVFLLLRGLSLRLNNEFETQLPLTNSGTCVQINNVLDLNNSDLIACTVVWKDGQKLRRFMVIDFIQLILVEPDSRKLGWGVAKFVGFLQDIEVTGDKDDSRCLHLTIHKPLSSGATNRVPLLSTKFIFDDHIRCMAAKQRLTKGRIKARQKKMNQIACLLDIPSTAPHFSTPSNYARIDLCNDRLSCQDQLKSKDQIQQHYQHYQHQQRMFTVNKVPGFAAQMRRGSLNKSYCMKRATTRGDDKIDSSSLSVGIRVVGLTLTRSHDGSPNILRPRGEEIPLEDMHRHNNSSVDTEQQDLEPNSPAISMEPIASSSINRCSEETSFTENRPRKKGQVETV
ncbi:protein CLEC16A homolog isoform X2 [Copidosoma floridanum]|nr:protein CLEC16A homolog isoform X2 [Copidosoma floridanum]